MQMESTKTTRLLFIEYRLDQLNNKHTRVAANLTIQYFEGRSQKQNIG